MSADRRRSPRIPCDLPVIWKRGWRTTALRVRDLNADGLFMATPERVELNTVLDLVVVLPDGDLAFLGVARFLGTTRHGKGVGVAIHAITRDDRARWNAYHLAGVQSLIDEMPPEIGQHLRRG